MFLQCAISKVVLHFFVSFFEVWLSAICERSRLYGPAH